MAESTAHLQVLTMRREKRAVALNSMLAAMLITSLKLMVGLATASLGILSEAAHSGLDLIAAAVTLFSVHVSDKPADADHQYGHGKVENFSAFIETGLLLLTCVLIVYEAAKRLFFRHVEIDPSVAAFLVMFFSMAVDFWRSRALGRIANKYDSQALQADALHFSTDIWSSGVVALGLGLVIVGRRLHTQWLIDADPAAALFVAGVILFVSSRLDGRIHVEQHLEMDEQLPLKQAHDRVTNMEAEIRSENPEIASILTHIESEPATIEAGTRVERDAQLEDRLRTIAAEFPEILDT